jgi:hypothetical protein
MANDAPKKPSEPSPVDKVQQTIEELDLTLTSMKTS